MSGTNDPLWAQHIEPTDRPDFQTVPIDVEGAVRSALAAAHRPADRAQRTSRRTTCSLKSQRDQTLPDVDALVTLRRVGPRRRRSGISTGTGSTSSATASSSTAATTTRSARCSIATIPNWQFALNVNYPIGGNAAEAQAARTRLLIQQNQAQIRASELTVATEVTNAALQVTNSIEALRGGARGARARRSAGSTPRRAGSKSACRTTIRSCRSQRDLREAQNSELRALLNYRKALVEFDRVQQSGAQRTHDAAEQGTAEFTYA